MMTHEHALKNGTVLNNYIILKILGAGGFGITYLAKDMQLSMEVVIKEYFPSDLAIRKEDSKIISKSSNTGNDFKRGMQRFKEEAQVLAKFNHPSIVKILSYFEVNNTAYFVMEYEEGIDLSQHMKQLNRSMTQVEIISIIMPILEGLKEVHKHKYLHRDIKPGNILLRANKPPVLIDFGASKLAIGEASKSITSMLTEGYAPLEQYSTDVKQQGPFTDIYAVAAVIYKMITGNVPPSAQTRSYQLLQDGHDSFKPLSSLNLSGYDKSFVYAIDKALSIKAKDRPQNVHEFQEYIAGRLIYKERKDVDLIENKKSNKGLIVAFVVVLLLLLAGIWFVYMEQGSAEVSQATERTLEIPVDTRDEELEQTKRELAELKRKQAEAEKQKQAEIDKQEKEAEAERIRKEELKRSREKEKLISEQINYYKNTDTYYNSRFGFSLIYPVDLLTKVKYPTNGDGVWMSNDNNTVEVIPSAAFAFNTSNAKQMYHEAIAWKKENKNIEITYKRQKNNWYVLSGYDYSLNIIFYEKYYLQNSIRSGFTITFPINEKKKYEELVNIIAKSFKPSSGEQ